MTQFKHTPEQARKLWVEALRSGKYEQGIEHLQQNKHFCCLGVLCEIFNASEPDMKLRIDVSDDVVVYGSEHEVAPKSVMEWTGLNNSSGGFFDGEAKQSLAELNDHGSDFEDIATIIESAPAGLFVETAT